MTGGGFVLPAVEAVGAVECWRSPADWLAAVEAALGTPEGEAIRREARVSRRRMLAVAAAEAAAADTSTGRNSARAAATIAAALGIAARTVGRARRALARLGASVTVAKGRYLTAAERAATGRLRAASTRSLTYPHGFRRGARIVTPSKMSNYRVNPAPPQKSRSRGRDKRPAVPLARQIQAGKLVQRIPWLTGGRHIGSLGRILSKLGVPVTASAGRILAEIELANRAGGRFVPDARAQRDPLAVFAWMLAPAAAALAAAPVGIDAQLAAANLPPRTGAPPPPPRCPPHQFDPLSGWCVHGCGARDDDETLWKGAAK